MNIIDLYYMECEVIKALCELTLDQILEVEYEFKKAHMEEYARYEQLFIVAINGKHDELNMREIIDLADKKKSAPSSATNTVQGLQPIKR